jgi:hypothetical protein
VTPPLPALRDWAWLRAPRARVRVLFPWARVPFASLTTHLGEFVVYTHDDAPGPWSLVLRVDSEPHRRPVDIVTVDGYGPHAVTLAVAQLAHDEVEAGHALIVGCDPTE